MYLLDTNIFAELLLDQERADEVERFLRDTPSASLHLSEFSLYSLGIVLLRRKMHDTFLLMSEEIAPHPFKSGEHCRIAATVIDF